MAKKNTPPAAEAPDTFTQLNARIGSRLKADFKIACAVAGRKQEQCIAEALVTWMASQKVRKAS